MKHTNTQRRLLAKGLKSLAITAWLLPLSVFLQACGAGSESLPEAGTPPAIEISRVAGSDWQREELQLELRADGDSAWLLELHSTSAAPANSLLLEARFDPVWQVEQARQLCAEGELNLLVSSTPGVLALGVIMPDGKSLAAGPLLQARLVRRAGPAWRSASAVPGGDSGKVLDLREAEEGPGFLNLDWSYQNRADYDQNSEVNIADLTPLSTRLGESTLDGNLDEQDRVLDGDGNTEVNIADITPLGVNFLNLVSGYRIYGADGTDPETAQTDLLLTVPFSESSVVANSRRSFSASLDEATLASWSHLFIRAYVEGSTVEGSSSNVLEIAVALPARFRVPPAGDNIVNGSQSLAPSLLLLPAIPGYSEAGAPVIVYTTLGGGGAATPLLMSYYSELGWTVQDIGDSGNYANPQARFIPGEDGALPEMRVIAYSAADTKVVERSYDSDWLLTGSTDVGSGSGLPTNVSVDYDDAGNIGVAHAYAGAAGEVLYSWSDGSGSWDTQQVYSGSDTVGGLSFRFDPQGSDPWLIFTHGTIDTSTSLLIDFGMEQARLNGGTWTTTPIPHPDSPLVADLGFRGDGTPQLAITAVSDYTINIPTLDPLTLSLLVSVDTLEYDGFIWNFQRQYESTFTVGLGKILQGLITLNLNLASEVGWARSDELLYSQIGGSVDVNITSQLPEDATLTTDSQFMKRGAVNIYTDSGYYSGQPGRNHTWRSLAGANPSCAYIHSPSVSVTDLLGGNFSAAGELAYWRP
jgi:hypothetical protein